jgi:hypothetical protein
MASFTKGAAAGNQRAFAWFIDDNGFPTGATNTAPSAGATGSGAFQIKGVKTASPTIPESDTVQVTGDDDLISEFSFASLTTRAFTVEYSVEDLTVVAAMLGTTLVTWGEVKVALLDIVSPPERNMGFIFQSRAKKQDSGVMGQAPWHGAIVPIATAEPLGRASFDERGAAVFRMRITPQIAGYDPFGVTIQSANYGTSGGRYATFLSEHPLHLMRHTGTGAIAEFTLDYQPISAAKTPVYANRVLQTTSSVSTSAPYSYTTSGNPASGAAIVSVYEHEA